MTGMKGRDPRICQTPWCEELTGHGGPHSKYVGGFGSVFTSSGPATLSVISTGTSQNDRHVELLVHGREVGLDILLTHVQQRQLARALDGRDTTR